MFNVSFAVELTVIPALLVTFSVFTVLKFNELLPKLLESSDFGIKSESNLAVIVKSSDEASPIVVLPSSVVFVLTVKSPVTVAHLLPIGSR